MASKPQPQQSTSSGVTAQEFRVRVPKDVKKKYSIFQFNAANNVDFTKSGPTKVERENNLKEFKLSYDYDSMPKYGAGSEFGREQKEEARRKKYGIMRKRYNPEAQPWILKMGAGKQTRKFKGTKNGGVMENSSFYIFTQCADGAFDAFPVEDWYNFTPIIKYKYLNSEEAEEEFTRRDKTLNYFSLMLKKRLKNAEDVDDDDEEEKKKKKSGKSSKGLMLTEMEDWADFSDENSGEGSDEEDQVRRKKKQKIIEDDTLKKKKKKSRKANSDDEAVEESDSMDEGQEIDYMSDSGESNDEDMYNEKDVDEDKYGEKGVEDEEGLRKLVDSDEEEEEEEDEKKKKKEDEEDGDEKDGKKKKKEDDDSDSESSSSSGSDSDLDKEEIKSALFMMKKGGKRKMLARRESASSEGSAPNSRSATPTASGEQGALKKRSESPNPAAKKMKLDPSASSSSIASSSSDGGITEGAVRRYLMRKPMTTTDLVHKFKTKNTGLSKEQQVKTIAQILKRLNPERIQRKDKLYLFIKKQ